MLKPFMVQAFFRKACIGLSIHAHALLTTPVQVKDCSSKYLKNFKKTLFIQIGKGITEKGGEL